MPPGYWVPIIAVLLLVIYELYAAFWDYDKRYDTLSLLVWKGARKTWLLPFSMGLLMGHFFL